MFSYGAITLAALAGIAAAQTSAASTSTVNLFINDAFNGQAAYAASVIAACSDQTTYAVQCTSGSVSSGLVAATCGPSAPVLTLTEGPSMYAVATRSTVVTDGTTVAVAVSESCQLQGTTAASCLASVSVSAGGSTQTSQVSTSLSGTDYHRFNVAVTGGQQQLASASGSCGIDNGAPINNVKSAAGIGAALLVGLGGLFAL